MSTQNPTNTATTPMHANSPIETKTETNSSMSDDVRSTTQQGIETVKTKANEATSQLQEKGKEVGNQVKEQATAAAETLHTKAEDVFEEQKNRTTRQVDGIASALRQSSQELRANDQDAFAQYTDMAAEQVEYFSGYVQNKGLNDVVNDVQRFAHRQPELFMAGMLAGGFLLGRFLRSSQRTQSAPRNRNYAAYGSAGYQQQYSPGNQSYVDYYNDEYNSPYPSGGYPDYAADRGHIQAETTAGQSSSETERRFSGGATAFNGERSVAGTARTNYGSDPAVTAADWGAKYEANEFGQSKPVSAAKDTEEQIEKNKSAQESTEHKVGGETK